jgi:hypothetical protein
MKSVVNFLGFAFLARTATGETRSIPSNVSQENKPIVKDGTVTGLPPKMDGVKVLVNGIVFGASDRDDLVMFDPQKTERDENLRAVAQGGWIGKNGDFGDF